MLSRCSFHSSISINTRCHPRSSFDGFYEALSFQSSRFFADKVNPPKAQLNEWYMKKYGETCMNESSFKFEEHFHDGRIWWTASFTCPKSEETYEAGTLSDEDFYDSWSWSKGDRRVPILVDNKLYYQRIKTAIHAAAGRRLDSIHLENSHSKPKFCDEDPINQQFTPTEESNRLSEYNKGDDKIESETLKVKEEAVESEVSKEVEKNSRDGETAILPDRENAKSSPKDALHQYYDKINCPLQKEMFESVLHRQETTWWSTNFICPVSGKEYKSGSLLDEDMFGETRYLNGRPYYQRKRSASHAAAAMAIDDIYFQLTGKVEPRLCGEDPSLDECIYEHPDSENRQLTEISEVSKNITLRSFRDDVIEQDQESLEGISIQSVNPSQSNTLQRVMEAWSDSFAPVDTNKSDQSFMMHVSESPVEERERIVNSARSWIQKLQPGGDDTPRYTLFRNYLQVISLSSCNAILSALAKANQIQNGRDVQEIADEVFNFLWSWSKPNTDTYNTYMKCLHGEDATVAEIAYEILLDMSAGKILNNKNVIPSPNIETFHTVMTLWAKAGDVDRCQSIINLMEERSMLSNQLTFEIMLSSFAHGRFDQCRVSKFVEEIKERKLLSNDAYFHPLRWGGKLCVTGTIPWDCFKDITDGKFLDVPIQDDVIEAEQIERWVNSIGESPELELSIGCYEAVIQAWLRTGTQHGFKKAERWALRSLADASPTLQPRLQTFLPLLATLVYLSDGPHRLKEWSSRLEDLGTLHPPLCPDGRVKSMLLFSQRLYQESLGENSDLEKAKVAATESSIELESLCKDLITHHSLGTKNFVSIETVTFCDVVRCWESFAKKAISKGNEDETNAAIISIVNVASQFRKLTNKLESILPQRDDSTVETFVECNHDTTSLQMQLSHLMHRSSDFYVTIMSSLSEVEKARNSKLGKGENDFEDDTITMLYLLEVESILRNFDEMHSILPKIRGNRVGFDLYFRDSFPYHGESDKYRATRVQLCSKIVGIISKIDKKQYLGDKVRILMLVLKVMIENKEQTFEKSEVYNVYLGIIKAFQSVEGNEGQHLLHHLIQKLSEEGKNKIDPNELNKLISLVKKNKGANGTPVTGKKVVKKTNARSKGRPKKTKSRKVKLNKRPRLRVA